MISHHGALLSCPLCSVEETVLFYVDKKNFHHRYYHCAVCDLVFVEPECRLNRDAEKARYDMHNNDTSEPYVSFLSRLAFPMLERLPENAHGLDFGSGISQAMADLFRDKGHWCACYDIFYYPDARLLMERYDFLVASEVIEHLYEPKSTFEQWLSMLKPNGLLGIMTGLRPSDKPFSDWWYKNDPTHVSLFSKKTFEYLKEYYQLDCVYQQGNVHIFRKSVIC